MALRANGKHDIEKSAGHGEVSVASREELGVSNGRDEYSTERPFATLRRLTSKYNVEQRGIERVPESEKLDDNLLNVGTMWIGANMVTSSFAVGVLAKTAFDLGFVDAVLVVLFFNMLGVLPVCFYSTLGPKFGLRQMMLGRFYFGFHVNKLFAVFTMLSCILWSSLNAIVAAQLLHTASRDFPGYAGILVIGIATLLVSFCGYNIVHAYEFWAWVPSFIVFLIVLGTFAHSGDFEPIPMGTGTSELGSVLSFGGVVFGFSSAWVSVAADYTCYQPSTQSKTKIFLSAWVGLIFPLLFTQMLGVAVVQATASNADDNLYQKGYATSGIGGLLGAVLLPSFGAFGRFCLVVQALTTIAVNIPNMYSVALNVQILDRRLQGIPRFMWTFTATIAYIAVAIPGYIHFEAILQNFLNVIGYWLAIYEAIALTDHFIFKRGLSGYDVEDFEHADKLPRGFAAMGAFCCGVVGMVMGMSQAWFVGPIALFAGTPPYGGDIGFELAFGFTAVSYLAFRSIELGICKR